LGVSAEALIVDALQRAVTAPEGLPLFGSKTAPGLFAHHAAGKLAALACKDRGLLHVVRTAARGRATLEYCALTEQGWRHLLEQASPKPILSALLAALERHHAAFGAQQQILVAIRTAVERLQQHLERPAPPFPGSANGQPAPADAVREALTAWRATDTLGDCPLPELLRRMRQRLPKLTIGAFHDALRRLHEERALYLHPWTGALYEMPDPAAALLVGHEVAYYASLRET